MSADPAAARSEAARALLAAADDLEGMRRAMEDSAPALMLAGGSAYVTGRYSALSDAIELLRDHARRFEANAD